MEICCKTIRHNIRLVFKPGEVPIVEIFIGLDRVGGIMVEDVWDCIIECLLQSNSTQIGVQRRKEEADIVLQHRLAVNLKQQEELEDDSKRIQSGSSEEADEVSGSDEGEEDTVLH